MGKVILLMNVSLDGYIETPDHSLDWATTDDELYGWFNERLQSTEVSVYGRRLFEVMNAHWPTYASDPAATEVMLEFGRIWNAKPKVVVSRSMHEAPAGWRLTSGEPETILEELRRDFSGDLEIGSIVGNLKLDNVSGGIAVQGITGAASLTTVSGDAVIGDLDGDVKFQAASGALAVTRLHGNVNAQTASGDVTVAAAVNGGVSVQTASGEVVIGVGRHCSQTRSAEPLR